MIMRGGFLFQLAKTCCEIEPCRIGYYAKDRNVSIVQFNGVYEFQISVNVLFGGRYGPQSEVVGAEIDNNKLRTILFEVVSFTVIIVVHLRVTSTHILCRHLYRVAPILDQSLSGVSYQYIIGIKIVRNDTSVRLITILGLQLKPIICVITFRTEAASIRVTNNFYHPFLGGNGFQGATSCKAETVNSRTSIFPFGAFLQAKSVNTSVKSVGQHHVMRFIAINFDFLNQLPINK